MKLKQIITLVVTCIITTSCSYTAVDTDKIYKTAERAYFEGQRDALEGDIRIKRNQDSCWIWTKSPWNSGRFPVYNPTIICD